MNVYMTFWQPTHTHTSISTLFKIFKLLLGKVYGITFNLFYLKTRFLGLYICSFLVFGINANYSLIIPFIILIQIFNSIVLIKKDFHVYVHTHTRTKMFLFHISLHFILYFFPVFSHIHTRIHSDSEQKTQQLLIILVKHTGLNCRGGVCTCSYIMNFKACCFFVATTRVMMMTMIIIL